MVFNHVEVICEGYDYPEDDYILLGSCGLEFTLDYTDPHDYHQNSYFKHMDDHEKELHHERVRKIKQTGTNNRFSYLALVRQILVEASNHMLLIGAFLILALSSIMLVRYLTSTNLQSNSSKRMSSYGPLSSAILTTKKAC